MNSINRATSTRLASVWGLACFALLGVFSSSSNAEAQKSAKAEVLVVLAKDAGGTIDAELKSMAALKRPPLNAFGSMKIIERPKVKLQVGKDTDVKLPNGRTLRLQLQQVMASGRFKVRIEINRPKKNDYIKLLQVVASPGDPFFVVGQKHDGGTLIVGVKLSK